MELDQVKAPAGEPVDRYLLITLRTPKSVPPDHAVTGGPGRPPLHFTAVLDVSGSMSGNKILRAKEAVGQALRHLHEGDHLSVVAFSDEPRCILEPTPVGPTVVNTVDSALRELHAGGMTALCGGLELGLEQACKQKSEVNLLLLLSDGQANVGETDVELVGTRGRSARQQGITVSTLGVGDDYAEALMAEIATQGGGRFYHLQSAAQIVPYLTGELGEAANLAARDTQLRIDLPDGAVVIPLTAAYPTEQSAGQALITVGDIPCDLELEVPLRLTLLGGQAGAHLSIEGEVLYRSPVDRALATRLNRVSVRFVEPDAFQLREGVVLPVVERVARQIHAAQVLEVSRVMARDPAEGRREAASKRQALRAYAQLLGDSPSRGELAELGEEYALMADPSLSKLAMSSSYRRIRSTKSFGKRPGGRKSE
jgi:Ca-activated chloride channel family protein